MSTADTSESLGPDRLSVRKGGVRPANRPRAGQSTFAESLDYSELALCESPVSRAVAEGESRRLRSVEDGIAALEEYIDNKRDASLVLHRTDEEDEEVRVLPYNHRWTEAYRRMVYAKLKAAEERLDELYGAGPTPVTLLSLTAHQRDENGDPRPPGAVLDDLLDGWDKFRRVLDRATAGWRTEYIRVVEPHESGYPHLHVAIFGKADASLSEKVKEMWVKKYGVGSEDAHESAVSVARGRRAQLQNPAAYLMKYLGKTTVRATGEQQQIPGFEAFSALLWATGKRQFSASEGLSTAMTRPSRESSGTWEFVGVGYGLNPGGYVGDNALDLLRHLESAAWHPPPGRAVRDGPKQGRLPPPS